MVKISIKRDSIVLTAYQPLGVKLSMQIEPPTVTCPVLNANLGLTTLMNGGVNGKSELNIISYVNSAGFPVFVAHVIKSSFNSLVKSNLRISSFRFQI